MEYREFEGVLFDIVSETMVECSSILRGTYAEAMADAKALIQFVNDEAEAHDDESDSDTTVGRVDESYCFVRARDGEQQEILYSEAWAA